MSRRFWLAFGQSLIGIVAVLSLLAQPTHLHKGPGSTNTAPTSTALAGGSSTADHGGTPKIECPSSPLKLTFVEREKNVDCSAFGDYSALLQRAIARRDAVKAAVSCDAACPLKTVVDRNFRPECHGSEARVVLDTEIFCTKATAALPGGGITLPPTTSPVTGTTGTVTTVPFQPFEKYDDVSVVSVCPQILFYEYHEKIESCANRNTMFYDKYIDRAIEEANRYSAAVTCVPQPPQTTCNKKTPPMIVWTSWDCKNNAVIVQVAFVACVP
ncbi:MAG TPA: hypothetical protein VJ853_09980 [Thermoanaerobaculia bacterium]|nr:hypothetical protein [Thermoanaerobaculia bacterium]